MVELIVKLLLFHASGDDFTILKYDVARKVFQSQLLQGLVFQHFAVADDRACDRVALDVVLAFALDVYKRQIKQEDVELRHEWRKDPANWKK